jgi:hypothetical protein
MTRSDMPRRVYLRHGAYYFVTLAGKWIKLSRQSEGLPAMYRALAALTEREANSDRMPAVITRWLDSKRPEWAEKTATDQERIADDMAEAFAEFKPADVTTPVCAEYLRRYVATPRTHNLHRTMLRQVLAFAALVLGIAVGVLVREVLKQHAARLADADARLANAEKHAAEMLALQGQMIPRIAEVTEAATALSGVAAALTDARDTYERATPLSTPAPHTPRGSRGGRT